jgi:hypothetical protein
MLKNDNLVRNRVKRASRVVVYVPHYFGKRFPHGQIWSPFFQVLTLWYTYIKRRDKICPLIGCIHIRSEKLMPFRLA